jgi:beta propeller repeat protein
MGHLGTGRASARITLSLLVVGLSVLLIAAPAQAKRSSAHRMDGSTSSSMGWQIEGLTPFAAPATAPGLRAPSIDGTLIACQTGSAAEWPDEKGLDIRFKFRGGASGVWGGPGDQLQPAVSNGLIAGLDNGLIAVFDPASGTAVTVSDTAAVYPFTPAFGGSVVVWEDHRGGYSDIYARTFDRASGQPTGDAFAICTAPGDQKAPAVDGDVVVWQDRRGGDWDVYGYDLVAEQEFLVSSAPGDQCQPDIFGDTIVWQDSRAGNWDIYAYDLGSGQTHVISRARGAQAYPAVSSDLIVWQDSQPRYVQTDNDPTVRYTDPDIGAYSLPAGAILGGGFSGNDADGTRQTRPDASGAVAVFQDSHGQRARGALRVTGAELSDLWAYSYTVKPDFWWVNTPELTFAFEVRVCPTPPVAQIGFDLSSGFDWADVIWEPFVPTKTVTLPAGDGRKTWMLSLKDSAGGSAGADGSEVMLDTHGPSCWAPSRSPFHPPVVVRSGQVATLPYEVTDKLSPQARAVITVKRADGSVVRTLKARTVDTGKVVSRRVLCDLLPGTYRYEVTATDLASNPQERIGTNSLVVR